jgi:hypothetical protein
MRCDCTRAKLEVLAEAEAWCLGQAAESDMTGGPASEAWAFTYAAVYLRDKAWALASGRYVPSSSHPSPAPERASSTPPSAATEDDGFVTVWPAIDGGVGLA